MEENDTNNNYLKILAVLIVQKLAEEELMIGTAYPEGHDYAIGGCFTNCINSVTLNYRHELELQQYSRHLVKLRYLVYSGFIRIPQGT